MAWQKKLRLSGPSVAILTSATCSRTASGVSMAQGSAPTAPPVIAATARSPPPAIGASRIGWRLPSSPRNRSSGQPASSDEGIIALGVELDQAEAMAERVGEHGELAVRRVAGLAFLDRAGPDGARDRGLHVL